MHFEIIGSIDGIEVIARGKSIRDLARLKKKHGPGNWRKLKGLLPSNWKTVESIVRRFTGTKRMAWVEEA